MYKRLLKDASLYSLSSVVARGFSLITVPIYTRILSPADYGALDLLSYLAVLVPLVVGVALDQAVARFYLDTTDEKERKSIASTVLIYMIFVYCLFIPFVGPLSGYMADQWLSGQVDEETVLLVFGFVWVHSVFYIANNQLKYLFLSRQYALCNIGNTIVSVVLGFIFIVYLEMGVKGFFAGQIIGQTIFAMLSLYYARSSYAMVFHVGVLKKMLTYSLPLVPGTLAFFVMQYIDRYMINEISELSSVGIYGIGARVALLINLFLMGFQGAWVPIVMKHFRDNDAPRRFVVVFNYYIFVLSLIMLLLSLFGKELLLLLTTAEFSEGFVVVPLLVLSAIMASIANYFTYGIQIREKSSYRLYMNLAVLILNFLLNLVLIPRIGILGAALATAISFACLAFVGMVISQRLYYVPYNWKNIYVVGVLVVLVSNIVLLNITEVSVLMVVGKFMTIVIITVIISKLLNVSLKPSSVRKVLSSLGSGAQ